MLEELLVDFNFGDECDDENADPFKQTMIRKLKNNEEGEIFVKTIEKQNIIVKNDKCKYA